MRISWLSQGFDGKPSFSAPMVEVPGRYNFLQASIYRLKLSNIRGRPGLEVYPTLEVVPQNPKTIAFLAHSAVPVEFTPMDFQDVIEGKYLVKVIYLPDPPFQELAATGIDEIISTRLEPGADPILEAQRRGSILLVIRMGNVDQEAPNTPPLDAGSNQCATGVLPPAIGMPAEGIGMAPQKWAPAGSINPALTNLPSAAVSSSKRQELSTIQPASRLQTLPDLAPAPVSRVAPLPTESPRTGGTMPPAPPMPPSPAELATQLPKS
jgi:hypothetical protein